MTDKSKDFKFRKKQPIVKLYDIFFAIINYDSKNYPLIFTIKTLYLYLYEYKLDVRKFFHRRQISQKLL